MYQGVLGSFDSGWAGCRRGSRPRPDGCSRTRPCRGASAWRANRRAQNQKKSHRNPTAPDDDEGTLPAPVLGQPRNRDGSEDGADVGAGVEDAGGEGAFLLREPLGRRLDGRREVARLTEAEEATGDHEPARSPGQGMEHGGDGPDDERPGETRLGAQPVDDATGEEHGDGVDELEHHHDVRVVGVAPVELDLEVALEQAQHLSVEVVDRWWQRRAAHRSSTGTCRYFSLTSVSLFIGDPVERWVFR